MGQYYIPLILDEQGAIEYQVSSFDFNNGCKLMEHSWLGNEFVAAVESLLAQEAPRRVVWAGDYADPELDSEGNPVQMSSTYDGETRTYDANLYNLANDEDTAQRTEYRPELPGLGVKNEYNWYTKDKYGLRVQREKPLIKRLKDPKVVANATGVRVTQTSHPFILNWDKHEFVSKRRVPRVAYSWTSSRKQAIHPLPLLTVEGNGRGGGDFHCDPKDFEPDGYLSDRSGPQGNLSLIGRWARDHISVSKTRPVDWAFAKQSEKWTEIHFDLVEMGAVSAAA